MGLNASVSPRRHRREVSTSPAPNQEVRRQKLNEFNSMQDAVDLLKESEDIVILSGAGISTSVGIPDFRSQQGLYNLIQDKRFSDPQQLFYRDMFEQYPKEFWRDVRPIIPKLRQGALLNEDGSNARSLINAVPPYSAVHSFLELLQTKDKLLTNFTQNIDALELDAGVDIEKIVACHGTWETATCLSCAGKVAAQSYLPVVLAGKLPLCVCGKPDPVDPNARQSSRLKKGPKFEEADIEYVETFGGEVPDSSRHGRHKRRRIESELANLLARDSDDDEKSDAPSRPGLLKPDITFFGESVAENYYPTLDAIRDEVDLLIIVGTSLAAQPVSELPLSLPRDVPQIWISNERCTNKVKRLQVDIELIGDADSIVRELCARAGWGNALANRIWKNHLGSTRQAKAAVAKAKEERVKATKPAATAVSAEGNMVDITTLAEKQLKQEQPEHVVRGKVPGDKEHRRGDITTASTQDNAKDQEAMLDMPATPHALAISDTSPQSIQIHPSAPVAVGIPTVQVERPPLSPPLAFRGNAKRPLSLAGTLSTSTASLEGSGNSNGHTVKKPRAGSPNPAKVRPVKPATSVSSGRGMADPSLRIFQDEAFEWVTYFKKPKV
ncbi:uncharacterized protein HMPREF1541_08752 [Cyphellophora europaea CBS 101466]|uniref:Deacetylase sirtuin-type domain-containing protein n=1 Tax=Cyphellophora europaea (strain CBS 101466) TaxID=1220924 RepID=W2RL74_CYPE1|nr:uncharacterized protein HMPREF1541_08752 [Cyphellophora europaea CBS 101466]ETN36474.1 hypothetical protein HMPREF1541_08752 [Cyphellophora europaea CBS 101466]